MTIYPHSGSITAWDPDKLYSMSYSYLFHNLDTKRMLMTMIHISVDDSPLWRPPLFMWGLTLCLRSVVLFLNIKSSHSVIILYTKVSDVDSNEVLPNVSSTSCVYLNIRVSFTNLARSSNCSYLF